MFECQTLEDSSFGSFLANACGLASLQAALLLNYHVSDFETYMKTCVAQKLWQVSAVHFSLAGAKATMACFCTSEVRRRNVVQLMGTNFADKTWDLGWSNLT